MRSPKWLRRLPVLLVAVALVAAGCSSSSGGAASSGANVQSATGVAYESTGTGPMVKPTIPQTLSVPTDFGQLRCSPGATLSTADPAPAKRSCTRVFHLTASAFEQKIANFPVQDVTVWGYNNSTPGPTLISYAGERVQIVVTDTAYEEGRTIGWAPELYPLDGYKDKIGDMLARGHTYTWELEPSGGGTSVTQIYDWRSAKRDLVPLEAFVT